MGPLITAVLTVLQALLPAVSSSAAVQSIINALIQLIPLVLKAYQDLLPMIKNIIAALQANDATNAEQIAQLAVLSAVVDANFDDAVARAEAEDAAAALAAMAAGTSPG